MREVLDRLREPLARFLAWWLGELSACVPARLRSLLERGGQRLWVSIEGTKVVFEQVKGKSVQWLGNLDLAEGNPDVLRDNAQEIVAASKLRKASVVLRLARQNALRRTVELPSPALENLREVLTFEMDRHTPFDAGDVYFDYRVAGHNKQQKRISVDLLVASRQVADEALGRLADWGLHADRLALIESPEEDSGFNLLASSGGDRGQPRTRRLTNILLVATVFALGLAIYLPLEDKRAFLQNQEARLATMRSEAQETSNLTKQVADLGERSRFVLNQKRGLVTITEVLNEVTQVLPDDTWLLQFGRRGGRLTISGYSSNPSSLISLLEESELLSEVSFSSPVTADPRVGRERFNITAKIVSRETE